MNVRKVENPPLRTAGPILVNVVAILWILRMKLFVSTTSSKLFILISRCSEESVGNMDREINTESHRYDQGVAGDDVQCKAPEVHKTCNLNNGYRNTENNHDGASETAKEDKNSEEYGNH